MSLKQRQRMQIVEPLLRKHEYGVSGSALLYMSARDLGAVVDYLTGTPRITGIGVTLTEKDAARIIGGTIRGRGNLVLAMQLDQLDNQFHKIANSLRNAGTAVPEGFNAAPEEDTLRFTALLFAEEVVSVHFHYHRDYKNDRVQLLYRYVEENPSQAYRIMEVAKQRYSLDVEMIKEVLGAEAPALGMGIL